MNQAIGRVIRHRLDYGCVVLCDARFAEERNRKSLSLWARPFVRECSGFGKVAADLTKFFKACAANPDLKHTAAAPAASKTKTAPASATGRTASGRSSAVASSYPRARHPLSGGAGAEAGAAQLSSLQDVGDIVESVGRPIDGGAGRSSGTGNGGGDRSLGGQQKVAGGGNVGGGGAAPLGLLHALKASAKVVGGGLGAAAEHSSSGGGVDGGGGVVPGDSGGGSGWDSVPLSQRLAVAGGKSTSGVVAPGTPGGNASKQKQPPLQQHKEQKQEQQHKQANRPRGLGVGRTVGSADGTGGGGGGGGSAAGKVSASSAAGSVPATPKPRAGEAPEGSGQRRDRAKEKGAKGADVGGGSRRRELAAVLVDLKKSVAPGAFDVFRSRARALKARRTREHDSTQGRAQTFPTPGCSASCFLRLAVFSPLQYPSGMSSSWSFSVLRGVMRSLDVALGGGVGCNANFCLCGCYKRGGRLWSVRAVRKKTS